jgi:hypothetical protein
MQILKKIITTHLLAMLVFCQVGYYFFYMAQQFKIRENVKQQLLIKLPDSLFTVFAIDDKNLTWEEAGKECIVNGIMYDVAKIKVVGAKKYVYCLPDNKETNLINEFSKTIDNNDLNNPKNKSKVTLKFQQLFCAEIESLLKPNIFNCNISTFPNFTKYPIFAVVSIAYIPPKV